MHWRGAGHHCAFESTNRPHRGVSRALLPAQIHDTKLNQTSSSVSPSFTRAKAINHLNPPSGDTHRLATPVLSTCGNNEPGSALVGWMTTSVIVIKPRQVLRTNAVQQHMQADDMATTWPYCPTSEHLRLAGSSSPVFYTHGSAWQAARLQLTGRAHNTRCPML